MILRPRAWYTVGASGLAAMLCACTVNVNTEGATASETRSFKVGGAPTVTLDTFDGAIDVHSWDRPDVEVVIEKQAPDEARLKEITVEQSQEGDTISLTVRGPAQRESNGISIGVVYSTRARLRVALPKNASLTLRSGDGALNVEDVTGTISLRTDDGSIVGNRVSGDVVARTDDGAIRFRDVGGKIDVESLDGSIVVDGTLTHLRVKTNDGSVRVAAQPGSEIAADWQIESGDGSVEVRLPSGANAEVDASTSDGVVRSNYPGLEVSRSDDDRAKRSLKGTLGSGGHLVRVRTGDGTIRFEP
jgi:hypothetical protein